jgi:hypothetical protein
MIADAATHGAARAAMRHGAAAKSDILYNTRQIPTSTFVGAGMSFLIVLAALVFLMLAAYRGYSVIRSPRWAPCC